MWSSGTINSTVVLFQWYNKKSGDQEGRTGSGLNRRINWNYEWYRNLVP